MSTLTKRAMADSLRRLLNEKPLDRITVSEITDGCGVRRNTFYYHFHDVYELCDWIIEQDLRAALREDASVDNWKEGLYRILIRIRDNGSYMENLLNSLGREKVTYSLCQMTQGMMLKLVELNSEGMHFDEDRKAFFAKFFQYAVIGMILDWIIGGYELTPEVLVCRLHVMVNSALPAMLSGMDGALEEVRQGKV
jgi:probable dihydroxyacetone kinase regulator